MVKKCILIFILFSLVIVISGCETVKGAAKGAAEGFQKDWESAKKVDDWMRKNLW